MKSTAPQKKALQEQLLALFREGERLTAAKVSIRLEERTGGRCRLFDRQVIILLDTIVTEGALVKEVAPLLFQGYKINRTEYFLPLKKE